MTKINNILWKLLGVIVAFLSNATGSSFADTDSIRTRRVSLCGKGDKSNYYIKSCNGKDVGINWLRSATTSNGVKTNVFSIDENNSLSVNTKNFRKYIAAANKDELVNIQETTLDPRIQLKEICSPYQEGAQISIVCEACPNGGFIDAQEKASPSVELNYNDNSVAGKWVFYTIADCYLQEYSDATGVYHYIDTVNSGKEKCYYKPDAEGYFEQISTSQD
ncbi:MAG: hypothetical protein IKZ49_04365 [Alphaproteobacteria bacterium]|nr:hypothetical protein [Alphaproteobacteria bacterium]